MLVKCEDLLIQIRVNNCRNTCGGRDYGASETNLDPYFNIWDIFQRTFHRSFWLFDGQLPHVHFWWRLVLDHFHLILDMGEWKSSRNVFALFTSKYSYVSDSWLTHVSCFCIYATQSRISKHVGIYLTKQESSSANNVTSMKFYILRKPWNCVCATIMW